MATRSFGPFLFTVVLLLHSTEIHAQEVSEIASLVLAQYKSALSSKSSKQIAKVFHREAVLLPNDNLYVKGRKGIAQAFSGLENINFKEEFEIQEAFSTGDLIVVQTENRGSWSNPQNNQSGNFSSKGLMLLKEDEDGSWKIFRYAFNDNPRQ